MYIQKVPIKNKQTKGKSVEYRQEENMGREGKGEPKIEIKFHECMTLSK